MKRLVMLGIFVALSVAGVQAQTAVGGQTPHFTDTSMLKPPPGQKIAVVEWEDLECPACAHAFPIVHEAIKHYNIPLVRYDFIIPSHTWSKQAETDARFMQDTFGLEYATEYRREVFATQYRIASPDDLNKFTVAFLQAHGGKSLPFVMDPKFLKEVQADHDLGIELGLLHTPTIVVVTNKEWIDVEDPMQLYSAIDKAESDIGMKSTATSKNVAQPATEVTTGTPGSTTTAASTDAQSASTAATTQQTQPVTPTPAAPTAPVEQTQESSHTGIYVAIGVGVLVVGGSLVLMKKRKSSV